MPFWKLCYHIVWATRNRLPLIEAPFEPRLYQAISAKAQKMGAIVYAIGGTEDHIHLAVSVPPALALSKFVGDVKGNSSHFVNHEVSPGYEFYWQEEYGILSFGEKNLPAIVRYIQNQKEHHARGTILNAMERMSE